MLTLSAAEIVGQHLKKGAVVVLESTVYPGVTEEIVAPILDLENESGLKCGVDFKIGYSPERINPSDEAHTLDKITKIVAGMDEETTEILAELYGLITNVYKAKDIKTAEAAKVIDKPFLKSFLKSFINNLLKKFDQKCFAASQKKAFSERTVIFSFAMTDRRQFYSSSSLFKILAYRYIEQNHPFSIIPSTISLASLFVITPPSSKEKWKYLCE